VCPQIPNFEFSYFLKNKYKRNIINLDKSKMLSQGEYMRNFPVFAEYAVKGWAPANRGFYGPPLNLTNGLGAYGGAVSADGRIFIYMDNNHNKTIPYVSGILGSVPPELHAEVRQCTQQTHDPIMCNYMGVRSAMGFKP